MPSLTSFTVKSNEKRNRKTKEKKVNKRTSESSQRSYNLRSLGCDDKYSDTESEMELSTSESESDIQDSDEVSDDSSDSSMDHLTPQREDSAIRDISRLFNSEDESEDETDDEHNDEDEKEGSHGESSNEEDVCKLMLVPISSNYHYKLINRCYILSAYHPEK